MLVILLKAGNIHGVGFRSRNDVVDWCFIEIIITSGCIYVTLFDVFPCKNDVGRHCLHLEFTALIL